MPHDRNRWSVELVGDPWILRRLAASTNPEVLEHNGAFYLADPLSAPDMPTAERDASQWAEILSAAASLYGPPCEIGVRRLYRIGPGGVREIVTTVTRTLALEWRVTPSATDPPPLFPAGLSPLRLARRDPAARDLLRLLVPLPSWANLYKALEVMQKKDAVRYRRALACAHVSNKAIQHFKRTANHHKAAGLHEARHYSSQDPPEDPMSIKQASELISNLAKAWLEECYPPRAAQHPMHRQPAAQG